MIRIYLAVLCSLLIFACKPDGPSKSNKSELNDIAVLNDSVVNNLTGANFKKMAPQLVTQMLEYVKQHPQDTICAKYLLKAGDFQRGLGQFKPALASWDLLQKNYPNSKEAPEGLFLSAFTYENDIKDLEKAKSLYESFLKIYPDHVLAIQVPEILKVLGKSPEELIKAFQAKQKETAQ
jgi:outer membrane protein assembly factor BamD (BamD/ComL family)